MFCKWTPYAYAGMVKGEEEEEDGAALVNRPSHLDQSEVLFSQVWFSYENVTISQRKQVLNDFHKLWVPEFLWVLKFQHLFNIVLVNILQTKKKKKKLLQVFLQILSGFSLSFMQIINWFKANLEQADINMVIWRNVI